VHYLILTQPIIRISLLGVEDQDNEITGDDFFDDSRIQNLVNAF
jgi:hypothetical protein